LIDNGSTLKSIPLNAVDKIPCNYKVSEANHLLILPFYAVDPLSEQIQDSHETMVKLNTAVMVLKEQLLLSISALSNDIQDLERNFSPCVTTACTPTVPCLVSPQCPTWFCLEL